MGWGQHQPDKLGRLSVQAKTWVMTESILAEYYVLTIGVADVL
ncbi:MAG: hypothetical protein WCA35_11905 [Kovacikia sp.]